MRFKKLDLNLLVALDALLLESSISRAAERVHLSQGAMSNALSRLREHFDDELLVAVGRRMEATPRAEALKPLVRDLLVRIDSTMQVQPHFDPTTTERSFRIVVSDYSLWVFVPHLLRHAAELGASARFEFLPQVGEPTQALERGEADVLIIPKRFVSTEHPSAALFEDEFTCLMAADHPLAGLPLTREAYEAAGHVLMQPASASGTAIDAMHLQRLGIQRRAEVTSYSFSSLPGMLLGTQRLATVQRHIARQACRHLPLAMADPGFELPKVDQRLQWHRHRSEDPGLLWLRETLLAAARKMDAVQLLSR
ncbi:LysR family transcriptional regulator [Roseateles sp. LYH14W]|uniref:LysR family transcriptional regulator n=1 Tax=Pelomonas parva TaxID=3299032 RepID=A0ABW7EZT9_9BURK